MKMAGVSARSKIEKTTRLRGLETTLRKPDTSLDGSKFWIRNYEKSFSIFPADDPTSFEECSRVRYQVYCVDHPFEDPDEHPGGMERDTHDAHSAHSLLVHRPTGAAVGTVRLILPVQGRHLPAHEVAGALFTDKLSPVPSETTGEISRFAIVKGLCARIAAGGGLSESRDDAGRLLRYLPLGLMRACVRMSVEHGITHYCALMEPALLRLLTRFGVHFHPVGPIVDHHGRRQPCWAEIDSLLHRIWLERPDVWSFITDGGALWPLHGGLRGLSVAGTPCHLAR